MSYLIRINEFSRKFDEPKWSEKLPRYVSGGFNKEIGFRTADVPQEIEKAIKNELLKINDTFPPEFDETALIARKFAQYSILAVATNGSSYGNFPLICYRYFWLENIDKTDFDGIGTLLKWWEEKEKPYCEIKPWEKYKKEIEENGEDFYQAKPIEKKHSEPFQKQTQKIVNKITNSPHIFTFFKKKGNQILPNYWGIHALALQINNKYLNAPISWSWNTSMIDQPSGFTLICCSDENNLDLQKRWFPYYEKLIPKQNNNPVNSILKRCLLNLAKDSVKNSDLDYLMEIIEGTDGIDFDKQQIIDRTFYKYNLETEVTSSGIQYYSLLVVFSSLTTADINEWLFLVSEQSKELQENAIELQINLLDYAKKNKRWKAYQKLSDRLQIIIIESLFNLAQPKQKDISATAKFVQWLLVNSSKKLPKNLVKDSYTERFKVYARLLLKQLEENYKIRQFSQKNNIRGSFYSINQDQFCRQVVKDLIFYEKRQNLMKKDTENIDELTGMPLFKNLPLREYKTIARIFYSARCYNLAALFYQLSLGYVPQQVYDQCTDLYEIIELKPTPEKKDFQSKETSDNENSENSINSFFRSRYLDILNNALVGLLLLGIGTGGSILINRFFFTPSFTVEETQPFGQKLNYYRKLSQDEVSERNTAQIKDSLIQDVNKINNKNTGIPNIYPFPRDDKAEKAKELQKIFIEQRKATLKDLPAYSYIASLTPKIDQTLSKELLEEMTATKASAENIAATKENIQVKETVKKVSATMQPILLSLGFYKIPSFTNTWDQETSNAIKKFQIHYKLPATGNLDQATWDILYMMIKDKQVQETAIVLQSILQYSQTPAESEEKINELENCKNDPITYSQCINKLKPMAFN